MQPVAVYLAPDDYALAPSPSWTRIDTGYRVQAFTIDRGRPNEMSRTGTGTATVELVDTAGDFDPTNTGGAFYGLGPLVQAKIMLQNPVLDEWSTLFRGFVSRLAWTPDVTERFAHVRLELVDALAVLAACEMPFDGSYGDDFVDGSIVFNADTGLDAVQTRINNVLDSLGWDTSMRSIFTGNVALQKTVYAPRSTVLQVIQDAADAEFPDVANVYVGGPRNPGKIVFHGRKARFHSDYAPYGIMTWQCGDDAAAEADIGNTVPVSPPLEASLDDTTLYTSALAAPQNIADGDYPAQYVQDSTAVASKGLRTWSAENLATDGGQGGTTALEETRLMAGYVRDNYKTARLRVGQLTVKARHPDASPYGPPVWGMLCGVDISDLIQLTTTHHGGGGFNDLFYVEGIHYQARPGLVPAIELTLDVSPAGYYDSDPWGDSPP